jgi:hypothetical protein
MEFEGFDNGSLSFLPVADRQAVLRAMKEIKSSRSSLYIGQRLDYLQNKLAPYGYFSKSYEVLHIGTQRTVYAYMYGWRNAAAALPAGAVQAMMNHNLIINPSRKNGLLGEWTETVAKFPPPASGSAVVYERWVKDLMANKTRDTGFQANRKPRDPQAVLVECFRLIDRACRRLPPEKRIREKIGRELVGLTMARFELKPERFAPVQIPEHFITPRNQFSPGANAVA